ncbi:Hypothetical protein ETEE_0239 [Edwardsiella anguillarum ET080813]|uniref:Uncharacterized protein n=1 Tax=Edwardsiella anguillarum ET080813 TaxID=667120 RepID=A0A076LM06_9GAMM|nr:Hypothetical protein ETEE_0239 [Edwardsiella anguillarum ET080813]
MATAAYQMASHTINRSDTDNSPPADSLSLMIIYNYYHL